MSRPGKYVRILKERIIRLHSKVNTTRDVGLIVIYKQERNALMWALSWIDTPSAKDAYQVVKAMRDYPPQPK